MWIGLDWIEHTKKYVRKETKKRKRKKQHQDWCPHMNNGYNTGIH
jgi:hypothetical protein